MCRLIQLVPTLVGLASPALGRLSSADILSVFPGNVTLTGTMIKLPEWDMAVVTNESKSSAFEVDLRFGVVFEVLILVLGVQRTRCLVSTRPSSRARSAGWPSASAR